MKLVKSSEKKVKKLKAPSQDSGKSSNKSLSDIMDFNRTFNIIYSGVEQEAYFNILYNMGIRNFLMSFHYVQNKHLSMQKQFKDKDVKFFIDSGAHTYQNDPKYTDYDVDYWEQHLQKYLRWVEKNRDMIFAIANFDFENVVGAEKVKEWNEKYFEPFMLRTEIPVCFVWHQNSYYDWDFYCKRYPYIGFSSVNTEGEAIELREYMSRLKTAEKNDSLVHGFGMTRTSMLTQLPFYTADSTTWLVGLQYGEMNFWTGSKMTRLKKDKWQGVMLDQIVTKGFDKDLLLKEDTDEVIKANVYAFIEAEEYIKTRLKSRMYWMKPKSKKRSEDDLKSIEYPTPEWLDTPREERPDLEKYAAEFNISLEDKNIAMNCVVDMTCFMNWNDVDYQSFIKACYTPDLIKDLHDLYINQIVSTEEEMVTDLIKFYKDNLLGENTTLLYLGTNFDRIVKEREDYITDEEYETVDVSDMDVTNTLSKYLPAAKEGSPAPEISDLDDEIFREEGIEPIRDNHGRFIKGQKQVLKPKKLYSNKYPKMACDMCVNAQKCPEYKAGYVCAFNKMFNRYNTRDMADIIQAMQGIAEFSLMRLQRGMITETMEGGLPDPNVSNMMNQTMGLLTQLQRMYETGSQEVIKQTKVLRSDGTQEMTTQVSNPQSGGILQRIFGDIGVSKDEPEVVE